MGIARILSSCCRKGESRFAISGSTLDKIKLCNQKNLDCFLSLVTIKMLVFIKMLSKKTVGVGENRNTIWIQRVPFS